MLILAAHKQQHTLPAVLGFLILFGSLGLGVCLIAAVRSRLHRTLAALTALSLAAVSYAWLKDESDTWWKRRCERTQPGSDVRYIKSGCGEAPPVVPFTVSPSD